MQGIYKQHPKLPAKVFSDYSRNGCLYNMAFMLHQIKKQRGMKVIDFKNADKRKVRDIGST